MHHLKLTTFQVKLCTLEVRNAGWIFEHVDHNDTSFPEETRIRGFALKKLEQKVVEFKDEGDFELAQD